MAAFGLPSATSVYIPDHASSGNLITAFSRNPATFKIAEWATYTPVKKPYGYYLKLNFDMCARMLGPTSGIATIWPRGGDRPQFTWGLEKFMYTSYFTQRHADGYTLDRDEYENADWDIRAQHDAIYAQKAMTERELVGIAAATTTGNYDSTHVDTATNWGGGYLNAGTSTDPIFKRALQAMFRRIHLDVRGAVKDTDMVVVMSPATANMISQSAEITDFLKNNQFGLAQVRGGEPNQNATWGLPDRYQNFKLVVDDTVFVPTQPAASGSSTGVGAVPQAGYYAWPWGTVAMLARPGGLISPAGGPSFSTVHVWLKEDMAVETFDDPNNRKFTSSVVNDYAIDVVAPVTGALCTSALATQPTASLTHPDGEFVPNPFATAAPAVAGFSPEAQAQIDLLVSQNRRLMGDLEALTAQVRTLHEARSRKG